MRRNQRGLSMIELLTALGIGAVTLSAIFYGLTWIQRETVQQTRDVMGRNEYSVISSHLKRFVSTGTLRFFGFSGKTPTTSPADQTLARFLVPLIDKCADLSDCPDTTALLYVNYEKTRTNSLSAICSLGASTLVVDLKNTTYGAAAATADGFTFAATADFPAENLSLRANQLLGVVNPPFVTLWVPGAPSKLNVYTDAGTGGLVYDDPPGTARPFPSACLSQTQGNDVSQLYRVPIVPASLAQFSGGHQNWDDAELIQRIGSFPMRVISVNLRSVGKFNTVDPVKGQPLTQLVVRDCTYAGGAISCPGPNFLAASPFERLVIEETFNVTFTGRSITRYEIVRAGATPSAACDAAGCAGLPIANPADIPVLYNNAENTENLSPDAFSFFKQQYLQTLRLRLQMTRDQREVVDVPIQ